MTFSTAKGATEGAFGNELDGPSPGAPFEVALEMRKKYVSKNLKKLKLSGHHTLQLLRRQFYFGVQLALVGWSS